MGSYRSAAENIPFVAGANLSSGDVLVVGDLVGVVVRDVLNGANGALCVEGLVDLPKTAGTGAAIAAGAKLYWDTVGLVVTTTAGSLKVVGYSTLATLDADTTVRVKLSR